MDIAVDKERTISGQITKTIAHHGYLTALALLLVTGFGFWLRVRQLGKLGLIVDEGLQALAVQGILNTGIPQLTSGVVYSRAVLLTYLQASAAFWLGLDEFSLRLPAVLFGTAVIPLTFWLATVLFGRRVGMLAAAVVAISTWEIELSRYARAYSAFQFFYLLSLLCVYLGIVQRRRAYQIALPAVAILAYSTHELAVLLLAALAVPWLSATTTRAERLALVAWAAGLGLLWFAQRRGTKWLEALADAPVYLETSYTNSIAAAKSAMRSQVNLLLRFQSPDSTPLERLAALHPIWVTALVLAAVLSAGLLVYFYRRRASPVTMACATLMVMAAALYQVWLVLIVLAACLVLFANRWQWLLQPILLAAYAAAVCWLLLWTVVMPRGLQMTWEQTANALFGFPDLYRYFWQWYVAAWPIFLLFFLRGAVILLGRFLRDRRNSAALLPLLGIFLPAILASFLQWRYIESRYTFHLYPLLVMVYLYSLVDLARPFWGASLRGIRQGVVGAILLAAALFLSQDASPYAALSVGGRTYREPRNPIKSVLNWPFYAGFHQDHQSPAAYVRQYLHPDDIVVVVGPSHVAAVTTFYLGRVDFILERPGNLDYVRRQESGGLVNYVTGSHVIDSVQELADIIQSPDRGTLWLLSDRMLLHPDNHYYGEDSKRLVSQFYANADYVAQDGVTFIVRILPVRH